MKSSRAWLFFAAFTLVACGDDGSTSDSPITPPPTGGAGASGKGGAAGAAGSASGAAGSSAGSSGQAGQAGAAGVGGSTAGQAGAPGGSAGAAGQAGSAGAAAGQAGAAGQAAGAGGDAAGAAGEAGAGGSGGSSAGAGGEAGEAGAGGSSAGAGQAGEAGSGGSGQAGEAGAAGQGGDAGGAAGAGGDPGGAGQGGGPAGGAGGDPAGGQGGSGGSGQGGGGGSAQKNLAFVTSVSFVPTDVAGEVDQICTQLASQAGLPAGAYVAWFSTQAKSARDKLAGARGWVRVDGLPFADTIDALAQGQVFYPLRVDETGEVVPQGTFVATGTNPDGTVADLNCSDWTDPKADFFAGVAASGTDDWTGRHQLGCSQKQRLYCFQVDHDSPVAPAPPPDTGRLVFVSAKPFVPGAGGLASADAQCNDDAAQAGLGGKFLALLATEKASAASRFVVDGRDWFRPDGVRVASAKQLLGAGFDDLLAPPNVTADAQTYSLGSAWTGDSAPDAKPNSLTCADWTSTQGPTFLGESSPTDSTWFGGALTSCDDPGNLLRCLQQ